ncbi:MAG: dihydrofolate reductase family protein [Chitinophaga sp.]|uniref:dihydrofolate reductase family protein n=1 Tax=Chitinophaga sp. TaxID=1869181 RepID=UPI001B1498D2|nr:dihydrofolate reductase family protein [Chitinophaga sp.]MBO9732720.1 dihydrofolate reductase family protein [Chitinophaga sp.]
MRKIIVSAWVTLDGVFDADTMGQWFAPYDSEDRRTYIRDGILDSGAFLFGRKTYEMLAPYWSSLKNNEMGVADQLNNSPKYVVSATLQQADWNNTTIISGDIATSLTQLKQAPGKDIQVEGSAALIQSLSGLQLIDEYRFLVHPVIMGSGKRFFGEGFQVPGLVLTKSQTLEHGVVALYYTAPKPA